MTYAIFAPSSLDAKGRCCGKKPLVYKRPEHFLFCCRCSRNYDPASGQQIENWAFTLRPDGNFRSEYFATTNASVRQRLGEPLAFEETPAEERRA